MKRCTTVRHKLIVKTGPARVLIIPNTLTVVKYRQSFVKTILIIHKN